MEKEKEILVVAREVAVEVNREFFRKGADARILSGLFDQAIARRYVSSEIKDKVRAEATRIAVKLRLERLRDSRGA
jgi:hypothetical protein